MEILSGIPCSNQATLSPKQHVTLQKGTQKFKLFVSSWNVGGIPPSEDTSLEDWLDVHSNPADIYVLGFQEIVPLTAGNVVLGFGNRRVSKKWNSLIRTALNKTPAKIQEADIGAPQKVHPLKDQAVGFCCIISKQMVGLYISVWIRHYLCPYVRHSSVSSVRCGIMGCLGNKGSVAVRFWLHKTSLCFVCSHLASGGKEGDACRRNADAAQIVSRTRFPCGPLLNLPPTVLSHDRVIWFGDLNYRINLPEVTTRSLVKKKDWNILMQNDQLKVVLADGHVFEDWHEGVIQFAPTYKYFPKSDLYYECNEGRKAGKKIRTPAWCDRIIWLGKGLKQTQYSSGESRLSDHRPVRAFFIVDVEVLRTSRGL